MTKTAKAMSELRAISGEGVLVLTAFDAMQQTKDGAAPFLQEANFLWATGIEEPGWRLVVTPKEFYLVEPEKDETHRIFEGGLSRDEVSERCPGARIIAAKDLTVMYEQLSSLYETAMTIGDDPHADYYTFIQNPAPKRTWNELARFFTYVDDCRPHIARRRAVKSADEIAALRQAISYTTRAFDVVHGQLREGSMQYEYEIEAAFTYEMRRKGADGHAYEPIVASGRNALTLHYAHNSAQLPRNGLVLIDIGARAGAFSADSTRTFALGTPSKRELAVHEAVQRAQKDIIALIKPGVSLVAYQEAADDIMRRALLDLGLLSDAKDDDGFRRYFPHAVSHGLGIDVHESLGGFETFQPGMVLTVEPGIYIPEEGIGVRIEDDILVTESGNENLSEALTVAP